MAGPTAKKVALPAIVDLDALDQIRDGLIEAADSGAVVIDASAVERVATNALIMLLSAGDTARRNAGELTVTAVSEPMAAAIERLGFAERFGAITEGS